MSLLLAAGIALGDAVAECIPCTVTLAAWFIAAASLLVLHVRRSPAAQIAAALLAVATGTGRFVCEEAIRDDRPGLREGRGTVIGIVTRLTERTSWRTRFELQVSLVVDSAGTHPVSAAVLVSLARRADTLQRIEEGMCLRLNGLLSRPAGSRNPGEPDMARVRKLQGISHLMAVRRTDEFTVMDPCAGGDVFGKLVRPVRRHSLLLIDRTVGGEEGEFLKGLLLGVRSGIPAETQRAFVNSGVAHILAVSGSNVAVVALAVSMLFRLLRLPRRFSPLPVSLVVVFYMLLTGSDPPVVRATVMALLYIWASHRGVRTSTLNLVGVAALVILSADPRALFDAGFQLSFAAVLAIVTLTPVMLAWMRAGRAPRPVVVAMSAGAMSVAASVGTLPLGAAMFGRVSLVGLLVNMAVVPASGVSVTLGMVAMCAEILDSDVADVFGAANRLLLHVTLRLAQWAGALPFAFVETSAFSPPRAMSYFALVALVFFHTRPVVVRVGLAVLLAGLNLTFLEPPPSGLDSPPSRLRLTIVDVGQGDAILIQAPDGTTTLVDAGPATPHFDAGERILVPLLRRMGLSRIDQLVLTHGHDDHAGGLGSVIAALTVGRVVCKDSSDVPVEARRNLLLLQRGDSLEAGRNVRLYVLAPEVFHAEFQPAPARGAAGNERSLVLRLVYGQRSVLLAGDAEGPTEETLVRRYGDFLRSDVLKVAHHGGRGASTEMFLARVRPSVAVISVGAFNRHGHPSPEVTSRLARAGARVLRTDRDGAVILETDGHEVEVVPWR